jgi:hypothetical protein
VHDVIQADAVASQNDFSVGMLSEEFRQFHGLGVPGGSKEHSFHANAELFRIKVQHSRVAATRGCHGRLVRPCKRLLRCKKVRDPAGSTVLPLADKPPVAPGEKSNDPAGSAVHPLADKPPVAPARSHAERGIEVKY